MLNKLSLKIQLSISVFFVQFLSLLLGCLWLIQWEKKSRFNELEVRLDTITDLIEDAIEIKNGKLKLRTSGESFSELYSDRNLFFQVFDNKNVLIESSLGFDPLVADGLRKLKNINGFSIDPEKTVNVKNFRWIAISDDFKKTIDSRDYAGNIEISVNVEQIFSNIEQFRSKVFLGALSILVISVLGTFFVVSYTTQNLRYFSLKIKDLSAPFFDLTFDFIPKSFEEQILFSSFITLTKAVRACSEAQQMFIASAAHELKTPIAAVYTALDVLTSKKRLASEYQEVCSEIFDEVKMLRRLSHSLLEIAKIDLGQMESSETCFLNEIVTSVMNLWIKKVILKGVRIQSNFSTHGQCRVFGSNEQWEIVLSNLIENAVKYGRENGCVDVTLKVNPNTFELSIEDNGIGMTVIELGRLGELFFRSDNARSDNSSFGLGFAQVKRIVRRICCTLDVQSAVGEGTKVTIAGSLYTHSRL